MFYSKDPKYLQVYTNLLHASIWGFLRADQHAYKPTEIWKPGVTGPANDLNSSGNFWGSSLDFLGNSFTKEFKISEEDLLQPGVTHSVGSVWEPLLSKSCLMGTFLIMTIVILGCL